MQSGHKFRECMPSGAKQAERLLKSEESGMEKALIPPTIHITITPNYLACPEVIGVIETIVTVLLAKTHTT